MNLLLYLIPNTEAGNHANETMPCLKNSPCRNFNGTNSTLCHRNSSGSETNCTKTDKCLSGSICDQNAICIERNGSSSCTCKTGFSGNGTVCSDIDDCRNKSLCGKCNLCIFFCKIDLSFIRRTKKFVSILTASQRKVYSFVTRFLL